MGQPAARLTDMHLCPMVTGLVPHVGGPISGPCCPTVLIGALPAARITDLCVCVGPPDVIVRGSAGVFIGGLPAARMLDNTVHGGVIVMGMPTVLIGETFAGGGGGGGAKAPGILEQIGQGIAEFIHDANMFLHGETVFSDAEKTGIEQALTDAILFSVSQVSATIESVWFRDWTAKHMPVSVRTALGIASSPNGGGDGSAAGDAAQGIG